MTRSANRREARRGALAGVVEQGVATLGAAIVRNPGHVGGGVAFLVVMGFVSSNALWYQPHAHPEPLLQTRVFVERPATLVPAETPPTPEPAPSPRVDAQPGELGTDARVTASVTPPTAPTNADATVERVQRVLATLKLYDGAIDGLSGPRTRRAVEEYRRLVGLAPGGIDAALLEMIGRPRTEPVTTPSEAPAPVPRAAAAAAPAQAPSTIATVQTALRAFGHDDVEVDGIMGGATRRALEEFQSLFGLPVTGSPDPAVLAKMAEIGLTR